MRRIWLRRSGVVAGVALLALVLRWTLFRPDAVPVTLQYVERGRVERSVVNSRAGTVESRQRAQMSPGISGLVRRINAHKGELVAAGDTLLVLDDRELRASARLAQRAYEALQAVEREVCLRSERSERERVRAESLHQSELVSDQELDQARTTAASADAECSAAKARVREAEANWAVGRATLAKVAILAPFAGVVLEIDAEVGEWITPSPPGVLIPPVVDLIDPKALYVTAPIDEADLGEVTTGLTARITLDAYRGREFQGSIDYVASSVESNEQQNRTLRVDAVFRAEEMPANLLPGLSADIEVILDAKDGVLRIPTYALLDGNSVLVAEEDRLVSKKVEIGLSNWQYTEIVSGLAEGEAVVTSLDRPEVVAGARVRVDRP